MRLNKAISHNSKYSRREADELIKSGKVKVNNKVVTDLSTRVEESDKIKINNRFLKKKTKFTMICYNKPKGEIVSKKDDRGRKTIYDSLPKRFSSFLSVGRLDYASEGLILLSDSVNVVNALMNSSLERVYFLKIKGALSEEMTEAMKNGLELEDATAGAHELSKIKSMSFKPFLWYKLKGESGGYTKLKVAISEGKNRELRRFFAHFDAEVVELKRVGYGGIELGMLKEGKYRFLENSEYENLRKYLKEIGVRY